MEREIKNFQGQELSIVGAKLMFVNSFFHSLVVDVGWEDQRIL